jgi:hypothetical protein
VQSNSLDDLVADLAATWYAWVKNWITLEVRDKTFKDLGESRGFRFADMKALAQIEYLRKWGKG